MLDSRNWEWLKDREIFLYWDIFDAVGGMGFGKGKCFFIKYYFVLFLWFLVRYIIVVECIFLMGLWD